jgi:hypothetical protein
VTPHSENNDERVSLTPDQLEEMMIVRDSEEGHKDVHTFSQDPNLPNVLLGCDMRPKEILHFARAYGAELSGELATSMKHGAVVFRGKDRTNPLFIETKPAEE